MYEEYYKLKGDPFALSPTGRSPHEHDSYRKSRSYLEYALHRGEGIVLITGEPGTGKTTLVKELLRAHSVKESNTAVLAFTCQTFSAHELVSQFARTLGLKVGNESLSAALAAIQEALIAHRREGYRAVLVLDEAQSLTIEALEQARLLSNYQAGDQPLVQIVLVGQPELHQKILSPNLLQLHQRIVCACQMQPLNVEDVRGYFLNRLRSAGWRGVPVIDESLFEHLHLASNGIPRWINQIGSRLMLHGMLEEKQNLGAQEVLSVIDDMARESLLPNSARESRGHVAGRNK